jgi:hypothetical protein
VLYVGDHIYGDILRSKKESAWRTAMIIQELDTEVAAHETCAEALSQAEELEERRARLEDELRYHQTRFKEVQRQIEVGSGNGRKGMHASNGNGSNGSLAAAGSNGTSGSTVSNAVANAQNGRNLAELEAERQRTKRAVERVRTLLREVEAESREIEGSIDRQFHPYWGSLLKEGVETSGFGDQVEEYACLYTSRVSNFYNYSPLQNFRSPRDLMPHEL